MTVEDFEKKYISFAEKADNYPDVYTTEQAIRKMSEINNWEYFGNKQKAIILDKEKPEYISIEYGLENMQIQGHRMASPMQKHFNYEEFKKSILIFESLKLN